MAGAVAAISEALDAQVSAGRSPGIVAMAATRDGVFHTSAHGVMGVGRSEPMQSDAVFRIFSMTKAIGTIAAVKLVEQGRLNLDTPVDEILPDFGDIPVLEGFDGDVPRLRRARTRATVRQLATHTCGLEYEFWNADQRRYMEVTGKPTILAGTRDALGSYPLHFEPGTKWGYGIGIDWLGLVVEAVTGDTIDTVCRREIFEPLGMTDTVFEVGPAQAPRLVGVQAFADGAFAATDLAPPPNPDFYGMGHCLYSSAHDYMLFLQMLLKDGSHNGAQVLKPETVDLVRQNHIGDVTMERMVTTDPAITADCEFFPGQDNKFTLGFLTNPEDVPEMRRAGSLTWAGVLNTHYWWDPAEGVAAVVMMQHLPFVDENCLAVYEAYERAVYASRR